VVSKNENCVVQNINYSSSSKSEDEQKPCSHNTGGRSDKRLIATSSR